LPPAETVVNSHSRIPARGQPKTGSSDPMKQVVIENPVLNSPFEAPHRHFRFDDEGITNQIVEARRISSYFIPVPRPKKRGKQLRFETEWSEERIRPNEWINQVRARVDQWRQGNHVGITSTTRRLLDYWRDPEREKRLFFCQIEALETSIYITEVAGKYGDAWIELDSSSIDLTCRVGKNESGKSCLRRDI
jgi:type III restriction enzyme